jgi:predicted ABC-type ATPase
LEPLRDIIIVGGPHGVGKTTTAPALVPHQLRIREFVNADEIARGLSPFNPEGAAVAAGRLMIERIRDLVRRGQSFAFETTWSGREHAAWLRDCKAAGWRVSLLFLWLPSPQAAVERVALRVKEGGHSIPAEVVIRRYWTGLANLLKLYLPLADVAVIYDNSDEGRSLIAERKPDGSLVVHDGGRWTMIEKAIR